MNRNRVKQIRSAMNEALINVAKTHNISLIVTNITFSDVGFKASVVAETLNENGTSEKVLKDWEQAVSMKFVDKEWLGQTFVSGSRRCEVVGYDFDKRKYPLILQSGTVRYKMAVHDFKRCYTPEGSKT